MKKPSIRKLDQLLQQKLISKRDLPLLKKAVADFPLMISQDMHQLITQDPNGPIAKQFVPSIQELKVSSLESSDPIGDDVHTPVKGIIHRHPDRCLFLPIKTCPVHCRFCFRKEKIGDPDETLHPKELEQAFAYIEQHPEIWEVILTGGDPLILKPTMLKKMIDRLNQINHVNIVRIHSRVPIVAPARIDAALISALKSKKPVYIVLHANHPKELTDQAEKACARFIDAGIPMLSQTILLKEINDDIETLSQLMRTFVKNRIKPYYLHHADQVKGTAHFRTTIAHGQSLVKALRKNLSGLCQPTYVLDIPGGYGKIPIGPNYLCPNHPEENKSSIYSVEDFEGRCHFYDVRALT